MNKRKPSIPHTILYLQTGSRWKWLLAAVVIALAVVGAGIPARAHAQTQDEITMTAVAGLDGYCKNQTWFPVRVTLENTGAGIEGQIVVTTPGNMSASWLYTQAVSLPSVSRKEVTILVFPRRSLSSVTIALTADEEQVTSVALPVTCLSEDDALYGVLAASPSVFNILSNLDPINGNASTAQLQLADIPEKSAGLEILDALVISDMDTGALSAGQQQAIADWVVQGGQLIVAGGPGWQKTAAGLGDLLPFTPNSTQTLPDLDSLQAFDPSAPLETESAVVAVGTTAPGADVIASQDGLPLVIHQHRGLGDVFYFAADPALVPLRNWDGIEAIYRDLLLETRYLPAWANGFVNIGDAADATANIPGLGLPSFLLICCFLGAYVVALGPLNYLILHRLKRRELAWITIPALVILFSGVAIVIGGVLRGNRPVVHEVALIQVMDGEARAQVDGVIGIFSPQRRTYDVEIGGGLAAHPLPGGQLSSGSDFTVQQVDNGVTIPDLRIDVGGIEAVVVEGHIPAPSFTHNLVIKNGDGAAILEGSVTNNAGFTLKNAVFLGPLGQSLELGDWKNNASQDIRFTFNRNLQPQNNPSSNLSGNDQTMLDILGSDYAKRFSDQDANRRYYLLQSLLGYGVEGRGGQFYVVGWASEIPFEIELTGRRSNSEQTVLYIITLTPTINQ